MNIQLHEITIRELTENYSDSEELGVRGYNNRLDIRPEYQREFVYDDEKRKAVIDTIMKNLPLNVMYWCHRPDNLTTPYEVMDGQQRSISICQYVNSEFSFNQRFFHNLRKDEQERFLSYKLMVYVCDGTDSEKLSWFRTINIAGCQLTNQEILSAIYAGPFVSDAKRYFVKNNSPAYNIAKDIINGTPNRQDYFETALKWISASQSTEEHKVTIEEYMATHQHDENAYELWSYFKTVIDWATFIFEPKSFKKIMKGLNWGLLYDKFGKTTLDRKQLADEIRKLLIDDEVQKKSGIIPYTLTRDEHWLGLREFPIGIKLAVYEKQNHHCANPNCPHKDKEFNIEEMEGDHITPWKEGGKTVEENCQMLCKECNRRKGTK